MDDNNVFTLNKIIRYLKELDADIICLQEVLYNQFALLKQSLKVDGIFAANINKPTLMYGIATLSKNEILYNEHIFLKSKGEQRGFLHTNIFSKCCCIDVINTHLGLDKDERKEQLSQIIDYTNRLQKSKVYKIFEYLSMNAPMPFLIVTLMAGVAMFLSILGPN